MQVITYNQWLPLILGQDGMAKIGNYSGYNPTQDPSIANVFAASAFRFGHTLVNPILRRLNSSLEPIPEVREAALFSPKAKINISKNNLSGVGPYRPTE